MKRRTLTRDEIPALVFFAALIFGGIFRFMPVWMAGFPVNDGGMFYVMMKDLAGNHFIPPLYTTYNNLNIPFAYPPLGFYLGAVIERWLNVPGIEVIRWLPAVLNTICILAFHSLSLELLEDRFKSAAATFIFALTPQVTVWLSAGGGLTRSLGVLFMMLTIKYAHRLLSKNEAGAFWGTTIFGSLTVLSHTESTVLAIILPIYIWLFRSRKVGSLLRGGLTAVCVVLIAGPWYAVVINRHGVEPLLAALETGSHSIWSFLRLINIDGLTGEPYLDLFGVLGILGIILLVIRREYFLPLMLLVIYIAQPRNALTIGNIPMAMMAGVFVVDALIPFYSQHAGNFRKGLQAAVSFLIIAAYILANSIYQGFLISTHHVTQNERTAMQWVTENTPEGSRFIVLTGESDAMCESVSEWFPALSNRSSLATLQGREWLSDIDFHKFIDQRNKLQVCIDSDVTCLIREMNSFGSPPDYIYVSIQSPTQGCRSTQSNHENRSMVLSLEESDIFTSVYRSDSTAIFQVNE